MHFLSVQILALEGKFFLTEILEHSLLLLKGLPYQLKDNCVSFWCPMNETLCFFCIIGAANQPNYKSMQFHNIKKHKKYKGQIKQMGEFKQMSHYSPLSGNGALHQTVLQSHVDLTYSGSIEKGSLLIYFGKLVGCMK